VPGDVLHIELAEELQRLAPFGMGNPEPALLVPSALLDDPRALGEGRHVAFTLAAGGARSRCVAFGRGGSLPAAPGQPVDAAVRLELNRYNGAVEPRLVLRHAQPARPTPIEIVGEPAFAEGVLAELDREFDAWLHAGAAQAGAALFGAADGARDGAALFGAADVARDGAALFGADAAGAGGSQPCRALLDARGGGIAGLLGDLVASGARVLAVSAHAQHRADALRDRVGGFALTTWAALEDDPELARRYAHVVAVDPPPHAHLRALAEQLPGDGWTHLAWGEPERELALRVLSWELDLRPHLADVYRAMGSAPRHAGEPLHALLRGTGRQPRSGALAGRVLRVLTELGLAEFERAEFAVTVPTPARTELDRSPAFRAYAERLRDGLSHLSEPARGVAPAALPQPAAA
jgi:single-stranded-DNA-specific exonuclease